MQTTTNLGLKKPDQDEFYDIEVQNQNMDIIDEKVQECFQSVSDGKELVADAITDKGVTTQKTDTFATMASNIASIKTKGTMQAKSIALSTTDQVIKADEGYDGLSNVNVPAVPGNATAGTVLAGYSFSSKVAGIDASGIIPDYSGNSGYYDCQKNVGFASDNVYMRFPAGNHVSNGTGYSEVFTSNANLGYTDTSKVLSGTVINGKSGTMANKSNTTADAKSVSQDDTYTYLTVPSNGYYNTGSKIRTLNSNLGGEAKRVYVNDTYTTNGSNQHCSLSYKAVKSGKYIVNVILGVRGITNLSLQMKKNTTVLSPTTGRFGSAYSNGTFASIVIDCVEGDVITAMSINGSVSGDDSHCLVMYIYSV